MFKRMPGLLMFIMVFALTAALALAGCGRPQAENKENKKDDASAKVITLKLAHHLTPDHCLNVQAQKFAEILSKKTNGRVKIDIYPNGQLGGQRDLLEAMKIGTMDMSISDTGLLANYDISAGILDLPYIFKDTQHVKKSMAGPAGQMIKDKILKSSGIRPLTIVGVAFRGTLLSKKTINSIEDFKGVKVRTPESPVLVQTFKSFGANPTPIPSGEAYTAIQTGVVDGMEGNPEFLNSIKIYEVAKLWTETEHNMTCDSLNISEKVLKGLPEDIQKAIIESANESVDFFYDYSGKIDETNRKDLASKGVTFNKINLEPYKKATFPMIEKFIKDNNAQELYDLIKKAQ
jgi:TRAP-type transport system periplasmic protein